MMAAFASRSRSPKSPASFTASSVAAAARLEKMSTLAICFSEKCLRSSPNASAHTGAATQSIWKTCDPSQNFRSGWIALLPSRTPPMFEDIDKSRIDHFWHAVARPLVSAGLIPNQITWFGFAMVLANRALYLIHKDNLWFGLGLAFSFSFDSLDGAVARLSGRSSKYGGYLDAVIDRYQEIAAYAAIAYVNQWWPAVFFALSRPL